MLLTLSTENQAFQQEVRSFMSESLPGELREKVELGKNLTREDYLTWHRILYSRGWIAPAWPVEYGGTGWSPMQRHIFQEELALAGGPMIMPFGLNMVGPVIYTFGSDEQKERFGFISGRSGFCRRFGLERNDST